MVRVNLNNAEQVETDTIRTTVHWSGLISLNKKVVIASGGKLIVDEGSEITFQQDGSIQLLNQSGLEMIGSEKHKIKLLTVSDNCNILSELRAKTSIVFKYCEFGNNTFLDINGLSVKETQVVLENCSLNGSQIKTTYSGLILRNSEFVGNPDVGLNLQSSTLLLENTSFTQSGGIVAYSTDVTINNCRFSNMLGSFVLKQDYSDLTIDACTFTNNNVGQDGHVLWLNNLDNFNLTASHFSNNFGERNKIQGLVIAYSNTSLSLRPVNITDNVFIRNGTIEGFGGAVIVGIRGTTVKLFFSRNKIYQTYNGTGLYEDAKEAYVVNNEFIGNHTGVYIYSSMGNVAGNIFACNFENIIEAKYVFNNTFDYSTSSQRHTLYCKEFCGNISNWLDNTTTYSPQYAHHNLMPYDEGDNNIPAMANFKNPVRFSPALLDFKKYDEQLMDSIATLISSADYNVVNSTLLVDAGKLPEYLSASYANWNKFKNDFLSGKDVYGNPRVYGNGIDIGAVEHQFANPSKLAKKSFVSYTDLHKKYILVKTNQPEEFAVDLGIDKYVYKDSAMFISPDFISGGANPVSYFWNDSALYGLFFSSSTDQPTEFILRMTDRNHCTASDTVKVFLMALDVDGVSTESQIIDITAFNFTTKIVTIESKLPISEKTQLFVYDLSGHLLEQIPVLPFERKQQVVLSSVFTSGVYVLKYNNPISSVSKKIIIRK